MKLLTIYKNLGKSVEKREFYTNYVVDHALYSIRMST